MKSFPLLRSLLALVLLPFATHAVAAPDDVDTAFMTTVGNGFKEPTQAVAIRPDGKILVGGVEGTFQGSTVSTCLWLLNEDGTLNTAVTDFGTSTGRTEINDIVIQPDGKILMGGTFDTFDGQPRANLVRLNSDLTLDTTWTATGLSGSFRTILDIELQADGKVLVGGGFSTINGTARNAIARLGPTGDVDPTFVPDSVIVTFENGFTTNGNVSSVKVQPDGKIVISGSFSTIGGNVSGNIARLTSTGAYDPTFAVGTGIEFLTNKALILPDGRILFGGNGGTYQGAPIPSLACFFPDGRLDQSFQANLGAGPNGWTGGVLKLTPEGRILVGGIFTEWNGTTTASMVRLDLQGNLDPTFTPVPNVGRGAWGGHFYDAEFEDNGNIMAVGWLSNTDFSQNGGPGLKFNGTIAENIVRFEGDLLSGPGSIAFSALSSAGAEGSSILVPVARTGGKTGAVSVQLTATAGTATPGDDFTAPAATLAWADGEIGPKIISIPLLADALTEGAETFSLSISSPTGGAVITAPASHTVTIADAQSPPLIVASPTSRAALATDTTVFSVQALSATAATYQWQKGGSDISGATLPTLFLEDLTPSSAGDYRVLVTNSVGTTTSAAATLTITLPPGFPDPDANFGPIAGGFGLTAIRSLAQLPDGKFLIGGNFSTYDGTTSQGLVKLNADYTVDTSFTAPSLPSNNLVAMITPLPDGRILLGGSFSSVGGHVTRNLAISNANGSVDTSFSSTDFLYDNVTTRTGVLPDGTIYTLPFNSLARLLPNGSKDPAFSTTVTGNLTQILGLSSGKLLVLQSPPDNNFPLTTTLAMANPDGLLASGFTSPVFEKNFGGTSVKSVTHIREMPDGRILVAGAFTNVGTFSASGTSNKYRIAMLLPDGTPDPSWTIADGGFDSLDDLIGLPDGSVVVSALAGQSSQFGDDFRRQLFRISPDGSFDPSFKFPNTDNIASNSLRTLLLQRDGRILTALGPVLNDSPSLIALAGTSASVVEIEGGVTLTVERLFGSVGPASVDFQTTDGTALAGTDYTATSGTLTWADGDASDRTITIPITDNSTIQGSRDFSVSLSNPAGAALGRALTNVRIFDDEQPPVITSQPVSAIGYVGGITRLSVAATSETPLSFEWRKNGSPIPGETSATLSFDPVALSDAATYTVVVSNAGPGITSSPAKLTVRPDPGTVPVAWVPAALPNQSIRDILALPDGNALIGGDFFNLGSSAGDRLALMTPTGAVDPAFSLNFNGSVFAIDRQPDGKILLSGQMGSFNSTTIRKIARFNGDGTPDTAFNSNIPNPAPSSAVDLITYAPGGKIYIGTPFQTYTGASGPNLARLNPDGTLDTSFTFYGNGSASTVVPLPDGKFYVLGGFSNYQGVNGATTLVRLNPDGTLDTTFSHGATNLSATTHIFPDGADGLFATATSAIFSGSTVARFLPDGSLDSEFGASTIPIQRATVAPDGTIIAASSGKLFRFSTDGMLLSRETGFATYSGTPVKLDTSPDGSIWLATSSSPYLFRFTGHLSEIVVSAGPQDLVLEPGTNATFNVTATTAGSTTAYQWMKNGVPLADGGNISGATSGSLTVSSVTESDEAGYSVLITNTASGATTTAGPANLTVLGAPEILGLTPSFSPETSEPFTISVDARGAGTLSYVWEKNGTVLPSQTGPSITIADPTTADSGTYRVTVTNADGSLLSGETVITVFTPAAGNDPAFPVTTFNSDVNAVLDLPDGRTLVGGNFTSITQGTTFSRQRLAVLTRSGNVDPSFTLSASSTVFAFALDPLGGVIMVGSFSSINGVAKARVARLNPDLTLDTAFGGSFSTTNLVTCVSVSPQGTVYIGGSFGQVGTDSSLHHVVRLLPNGSVDPSFKAPLSFSSTVNALEALPDGKVMIGGNFFLSTFGFQNNYFARLNADGSHDITFTGSAQNVVNDILPRPGGKWLVAGTGGTVRLLEADGSIDASWTTSANSTSTIRTLGEDAAGKIYLGGNFTSVNGSNSPTFAALDASGVFDPTFDVRNGTNGSVNTQEARALGGRWIAGPFSTYRGKTASRLALLNGDPIDLAITLQPRAASREAGQDITFRVSALGTSPLTYLWKKDGSPLPADARISGRDTSALTLSGATLADEGLYTVTVTNPTSGDSLESVPAEMIFLAAPEIVTAPSSVTTEVGLATEVKVTARGAANLSYSWTLGGNPLLDGPEISGATTPFLTLLRPLAADSGTLVLTVSNALGSTTASIPLAVTRPPGSRDRLLKYPFFNNIIFSISPGPGDTVAVGGQFNNLTLPTGSSQSLRGLAVIDLATGLPDLAYPALPTNGQKVNVVARGGSGEIYIGGNFTSLRSGNVTTSTPGKLARIMPDKSLDTVFNTNIGNGASLEVTSILPLPSGKILVGGYFLSFNGQSGTNHLVLLNSDGTVDTGFTSLATGTVNRIYPGPGGTFYLAFEGTYGGESRVARINADGTVDSGFDYTGTMPATDLVPLSDGSLLSTSSNFPYLQKISSTGAVIPGFPTPNSRVNTSAPDQGGAVFAGGFSAFGSDPLSALVRIAADGSADSSVSPSLGFGSGGTPYAMATDASNRIYIGGFFSSYNGEQTGGFIVLNGRDQSAIDPFEIFTAGLPLGQRGITDDPDNDGLPNLMEFAYGLTPDQPDQGFTTERPAPAAMTGADLNTAYPASGFLPGETYRLFRLLIPKDPRGTTLTVQTTTDLVSFNTDVTPILLETASFSADYDVVTYAYSLSQSAAPTAMHRISITR